MRYLHGGVNVTLSVCLRLQKMVIAMASGALANVCGVTRVQEALESTEHILLCAMLKKPKAMRTAIEIQMRSVMKRETRSRRQLLQKRDLAQNLKSPRTISKIDDSNGRLSGQRRSAAESTVHDQEAYHTVSRGLNMRGPYATARSLFSDLVIAMLVIEDTYNKNWI
jgi:hypothetical protein